MKNKLSELDAGRVEIVKTAIGHYITQRKIAGSVLRVKRAIEDYITQGETSSQISCPEYITIEEIGKHSVVKTALSDLGAEANRYLEAALECLVKTEKIRPASNSNLDAYEI